MKKILILAVSLLFAGIGIGHDLARIVLGDARPPAAVEFVQRGL